MTRIPSWPLLRRLFVGSIVVIPAALVLAVGEASASATYTCSANAAADEAALQPLIDAGGTVTLLGPKHCDGNYTAATGHAVTIQGGTPGATLDGRGMGTVLRVSGGTSVALVNLSVTGGNTNAGCPSICGGPDGDDGGGISVDGSQITVTNSQLSDNTSADEGGAVMAYDGASVTLVGTTVSRNSAAIHGGGVNANCAAANSTPNTLSVTASTITRNTSGHAGGGIYTFDASVLVQTTTIASNTATDFGGGIEFESPAGGCASLASASVKTAPRASQRVALAATVPYGLTIANSTIDHNSVSTTLSGGIDIYTGCTTDGSYTPVAITDSKISSNRAPGGGGLSQFAECGQTASLVASGTSFSGNRATTDGGAINNSTDGASNALITLARSSIGRAPLYLNDNTAQDGAGIWNYGNGASVSLQAGAQILHNEAKDTGGGIYNICQGSFLVAPGALIASNHPNNVYDNPALC